MGVDGEEVGVGKGEGGRGLQIQQNEMWRKKGEKRVLSSLSFLIQESF